MTIPEVSSRNRLIHFLKQYFTAKGEEGDVNKAGIPEDNQIAVWTNDSTIEGTSDLTFDGSNLTIAGDLTVGGAYTLPATDGTANEVLTTDGNGNISFQSVAAVGGGDVSKTGTPLNNHIAVWTNGSTIEGTSGLTFDGATLAIGGDLTVTGNDIKGSGGTAITMDGSNNVTIAGDLTVGGLNIKAPADNNLFFNTDKSMYFDIDEDNDETDRMFAWRSYNTTLMTLEEEGTLTAYVSQLQVGSAASWSKIVDGDEANRIYFDVSATPATYLYAGDAGAPQLKVKETEVQVDVGLRCEGGTIDGPVDDNLFIRADSSIFFDCDEDNDSSSGFRGFYWRNGTNTTVAFLNESGDLDITGDLTVEGGNIIGPPGHGADLNIKSNANIYFDIDSDDASDGINETTKFYWRDATTNIMELDESGNLTADGNITADGGTLILNGGMNAAINNPAGVTRLKIESAGSVIIQDYNGDENVTFSSQPAATTLHTDTTIEGDLTFGTATSYIKDASGHNRIQISDTGVLQFNDATGTQELFVDNGYVFVTGELWCNGNTIRDNGGNTPITFDGSGNTILAGELTVAGNVIKNSGVQTALQFDAWGRVTKPNNPAFSARGTNNQSISAATWTKIEFDTENYDTEGNFSTTHDQFTAPVTGKYILSTQVRLASVSSDADQYVWIKIVTSNRSYYHLDATRYYASNLYATPSLTVVADMDIGDTAYVQVLVNKGTTNTQGLSGANYTAFQGALLG